MERMASDDLQILQNRNRSPPRSPFLATLLRRQSKTDPKYPDINFKEQRRIVVMGAAKVGKSCIVHKFLYDQFTPKYSRTIEDLHVADYNLSTGASLTLEILDTTGSYQFPAMRALSISNANAFVLVYSVGDLESWRRVHDLRYEVSVRCVSREAEKDEDERWKAAGSAENSIKTENSINVRSFSLFLFSHFLRCSI